MHIEQFILDLALMLAAAGLSSLLAKKLKQPAVLGYIIAGFLISPNFTYLPTVVATEDINVWAELGIIFLMFALGLEFSFKKIAVVGKSAIITAFSVMSTMIVIGYVTGIFIGWDKSDSIFLGCMLSMSSTMIILKTYDELKIRQRKFAQVVLGALVIEDIGGIFMMIILSTVAAGKSSAGAAEIVSSLGIMLIYLVIWFALGVYLIPTFLSKAEKLMNDETLLIVSVAICFLMVVIASLIGFSSALGAFLAGSIIAGTVMGEKIDHLIAPVKDLFGAVFFISVGMLIQPDLLVKYIIPILIITVVTIVGQMTFSTVGMLLGGNTLKTSVQGGFSMMQIGEFSFILATLGTNLGVTSNFLYPIVVCVSVITSFTTPVFIRKSEKAYEVIDKKMPKKLKVFIHRYAEGYQSSATDSLWSQYLKKYTIRTLICFSGMFAMYYIGTRILPEKLYGAIPEDAVPVTCILLMMIVYIAMISLISAQKNMIFSQLWLAGRRNRLPLTALNAMRLLGAMTIIMTSIEYFWSIPVIIPILIGIVLIILISKSNFTSSVAIRMEMRFLSNFSNKQLMQRKEERHLSSDYKWIDEKVFVSVVRIDEELVRNTIRKLAGSSLLNILILKIIRDGKHIIMPTADTEVYKGDELHVLGTQNAIKAFNLLLREVHAVDTYEVHNTTLREYKKNQEEAEMRSRDRIVLVTLPVTKDSEFAMKSIRHSGIRKHYSGFVIGIERDALPIITPNIETIIEPGDLLWVAGGKQMAYNLLFNGLLDNDRH